ncbi:YfdX family protein [Shinella zoogloeoides]
MPLHLHTAITALSIVLLSVDALAPAHAAPVRAAARDSAGLIRPIDEAYRAVREIREARQAIFDGAPDKAIALVSEAKTDMQVVQRHATDLAVPVGKRAKEGDAYIPLDVLLVLSKGFKPTDETRASVDKANVYIAKGEYRLAITVLKAADIGITVSATLVPANASLRSVEAAARLLDVRKYYEASQALKAVEDSVVVEAYDTDGIPVREQ